MTNDSDVDNSLTVASFTVAGDDTVYTVGQTPIIVGVGSLTIASDGAYTFIPVLNYNGSVPVATYTTNTNSTSTLSITVTPVNDASVLVPDTKTIAEDGVASGNVLTNDNDVDNSLTVASFTVAGDDTVYTVGQTPIIVGVGSLTIASDGAYTFIPVLNYNGSVPVATYTTNTNSTSTLSITVTPVNDAPALTVTVASLATGTEDVAYTVSAANLLAGYTDVDLDTLSVANLVADHGTVTVNLDGTYTITQAANFNGAVVLSYNVTDGLANTATTLGYSVTAVNEIAASALSSLDNKTSVTVDAHLVTTITGTGTEIAAVAGAVGITKASDYAAIVTSGAPTTLAELVIIDANTTGVVTATITGTALNLSTLSGSNNAITINGTNVNDSLTGSIGNDTLDGFSGADTMIGGDGSDTYIVDNKYDKVVETNAVASAGGTDQVNSYLANYTLGSNVENGSILATGAANLTGNKLDNVFYAATGNNVINGGAGSDSVSYLYGVTGTDGAKVNLGSTVRQNTIGSGSDKLLSIENLIGSNNDDTFTGNSLNNILNGGNGNDVLKGAAGRDTLIGGAGNDVLIGGKGLDALTGGAGNDIFKFIAYTDLGVNSTRDLITDFTVGQDKIDLSLLDANSKVKGDQAFTYVTGAFTAPGQVSYDAQSGLISINTNANVNADYQIELTGHPVLSASDFIL